MQCWWNAPALHGSLLSARRRKTVVELVLGYGLVEARFSFGVVVRGLLQEESAFETAEFCFVPTCSILLYQHQRFSQDGESFFDLSVLPICFSEQREKVRLHQFCSSGAEVTQSLAACSNDFLCWVLHRQRPTM